jgi:hypothetical protein
VGGARTHPQRRVVRGDVPDVVLDDQLQQQDDHDHPGGLEQPLVQLLRRHAAVPDRLLPAQLVLLRQQPGDAVVLAHHEDVERGAADGGVAVLQPDGEEQVLLPLRNPGQQDVQQERLVVQSLELRLDRVRAARGPL